MDKATAKFKLENLIFEMDYYSSLFDSYTDFMNSFSSTLCEGWENARLDRCEISKNYSRACDEYSRFSDDLFASDFSLWKELMVEFRRIGKI
jgi:hypothetical protein